MSPLQRLIVERMKARGWSNQHVEDRGVPHATLMRYINPLTMKAPPREATLRQLADALDLSFEQLRDAALASMREAVDAPPVRHLKPAPSPPSPRGRAGENEVVAAIQRDPYLLPEAKEHFLNQYELLLRIGRQGERALGYVAHGEAEEPLDPKREAELEEKARTESERNRRKRRDD